MLSPTRVAELLRDILRGALAVLGHDTTGSIATAVAAVAAVAAILLTVREARNNRASRYYRQLVLDPSTAAIESYVARMRDLLAQALDDLAAVAPGQAPLTNAIKVLRDSSEDELRRLVFQIGHRVKEYDDVELDRRFQQAIDGLDDAVTETLGEFCRQPGRPEALAVLEAVSRCTTTVSAIIYTNDPTHPQ